MAWRRHHFQGQFGINETPLTIAIENGNFTTAEEIILATADPTHLNDGPYEKIPLHMVLTNNHHTDQSRNLRIAKLLVEKGANANLRIPYGDMDRASPSPFEELVVYYEVLKTYIEGNSDILCEELDMYFELEEIKLEFITNTVDFSGSKCMPTVEDCHKLIEQTNMLSEESLEEEEDLSDEEDFSGSEDEEEKINGEMNGQVHRRRKISCNYETLSSESENLGESLCEEAVEVAPAQPLEAQENNFQIFNGECVTSSGSAEDFSASEPLSDSSW